MKVIIRVISFIGNKDKTSFIAKIVDLNANGIAATEKEAVRLALEKLEQRPRLDQLGIIKLGEYDGFTWYVAHATLLVAKKPFHVRVCEEYGIAHLLAALDGPVTVTSIGPRLL